MIHHDQQYCKNCGQHLLLEQKFCHECGQKTDTHRINFHFLVHEVQHGIFHVDKGILYTLKELFTRPGHTIREYLEGRRQNHFKPVLFIMILGSLIAFVNHFFYKDERIINNDGIIKLKEGNSSVNTEEKAVISGVKQLAEYFEKAAEWTNDHFAISMLLMVPFFAFAFYIVFKKYRYNYPEWLVISTFITGQLMAVYLVFLLIKNFLPDLDAVYFLLVTSLSLWTMIQFFHNRKKTSVVLRTLFSLFLYYFLFVVFIAIFSMSVIMMNRV